MDERPELWTWVAPGMQLRFRTPLDLDCGSPGSPTAVAVGAGSGLLALYDSGSGPAVEHRLGWGTVCQTVTRPDVVDVTASGPHLAVVRADPEGLVLDLLTPRDSVTSRADSADHGATIATVHLPPAERVSLRHHGDVVTVHDHTREHRRPRLGNVRAAARPEPAGPSGRAARASVRCGVGVGVGVDEPSTPLAPLSAGAMSSDPGAGMY